MLVLVFSLSVGCNKMCRLNTSLQLLMRSTSRLVCHYVLMMCSWSSCKTRRMTQSMYITYSFIIFHYVSSFHILFIVTYKTTSNVDTLWRPEYGRYMIEGISYIRALSHSSLSDLHSASLPPPPFSFLPHLT